MAQHRPSDPELGVKEVLALVEARFPPIEFDGAEDWEAYVDRNRQRRAQRRAFAARYGFTPLDLFYAQFHPREGDTP